MTHRDDWRPLAPPLSDKLTDWAGLADVGGEGLIHGKDVLDVGPLYGVDALVFASKAKSYTLLDYSEAVLEHCHNVEPLARLVRGDVCQPWPLESAGFDTVLDFSTFDDVEYPERAYAEAARVLRPGGSLVTSFANARVVLPPTDYQTQDPGDLERLLVSLGLEPRTVQRREQARAIIVAHKQGLLASVFPTPIELLERIGAKASVALRRRHDTDTAFDLRDIVALCEGALLAHHKEKKT